jgi:hypothetical protein
MFKSYIFAKNLSHGQLFKENKISPTGIAFKRL